MSAKELLSRPWKADPFLNNVWLSMVPTPDVDEIESRGAAKHRFTSHLLPLRRASPLPPGHQAPTNLSATRSGWNLCLAKLAFRGVENPGDWFLFSDMATSVVSKDFMPSRKNAPK